MKTYWGSRDIAPRILNLGAKWRLVVSFTPRPLYSRGKNTRYALDRTLGGPHSRSGRDGEEKNSQPLPGLEPHTNKIFTVLEKYFQCGPIERKNVKLTLCLIKHHAIKHEGKVKFNFVY